MNEINVLATRSLRFWVSLLSLLLFVAGAGAQTVPTIWDSGTTYTFGDEVLYNGNTYKCTGENNTTGITPTSEAFDSYGILVWELYNVDSSVNVTVGSGEQFDSFANAWKYVKDAIIANGNPGSSVTILIGSGGTYNENFSGAMSLDQAYGSQVYIKGQGTVNFNFSGTNGIIVDTGHTLALLQGVNIINNASGSTSAVQALDGGIVALKNVGIEGFYNGLDAERKSEIYTDGTIQVASFTNNAIYAFHSSHIYINSPISVTASGANGFVASEGSEIYALGCSVSNVTNFGFYSYGHSHIYAVNASATNCPVGFIAQRLSMIEADNTSFGSNSTWAYEALTGSGIANPGVSGDSQFADGFSFIDNTGN